MSVSAERLQNPPSKSDFRKVWACRRLLAFTEHTFPAYTVNWHHRLIAEKLDAVVRGDITRLMIFVPPRFGKTELASRRLPAFLLGKNPDEQVITVSYSADLASQNNRDVQRIIDSPRYQEIFPDTMLSGQNVRTLAYGNYLRNSEMFEVVGHSGFYKSAGVGGGIVGRGFTCGIIDDPVKNAEEANSPTYREKVWEWYTTTFYTRQEKNARIILIMTRWHDDDLAGRLLEQTDTSMYAEEWDVVELQAIKEKEDVADDPREIGEVLWPEKYSLESLRTTKAVLGSYAFSAQYQQDPRVREGGMFSRGDFEIVDQPPGALHWVRYWDLAATEKKQRSKSGEPAYTAGVKMAEKDGIFYIADVRRAQVSPAGVERLIQQTAQLDGAGTEIYMEQEPGSGGKNTIDHYARRILRGFSFRGDRPSGSKEVRAEPLSAAAENGNVKLVKGRWNSEFLDEAESFPRGKFKDQIDAASGAHSKLAVPLEFYMGRV